MRSTLTIQERERFETDGYLMAKNAVSLEQLTQLQSEIEVWVNESRQHTKPYGEQTIDGRPRFDMGTDHTALKPALRRINNPSDISKSYFQVMSDSKMVDMVADLIGINVKFHHCKINLKCPGANTTVHYHQDFAFTPHSNDDVVTALLLLDDVTENNGCLMVVPGSHKGEMYSLYDGKQFIGRVDDATEAFLKSKQIPVVGSAGDVCLMHTRLAHGSAPNKSENSRGYDDFWIVKIDQNGSKIWDKRYGAGNPDRCRFALELNSGDFVLGGMSLSGTYADKDVRALADLKLQERGIILPNQTIYDPSVSDETLQAARASLDNLADEIELAKAFKTSTLFLGMVRTYIPSTVQIQ